MVVFVTKNKDTFNNPLLYSIFKKLEKEKVRSILICEGNSFKNNFALIKEFNPKTLLKPKIRKNLFKYFYQLFKYLYLYYFPLCLIILKGRCIIGIDPEGLIWAGELKKRYFPHIPLDYFSFEIFYDFDFPEKLNEKEICKSIRNLIIQDELRDNIIRDLNLISGCTKSIYIPVSLSNDLNVNINHSGFHDIRKEFGIPNSKKLIVNFGSFESWSGGRLIYDLISGNHLKDRFVFVIHSRYPLDDENELHRSIKMLAEDRDDLIISNYYIDSFKNTIEYLKQFDFATVFYLPKFGLRYIGNNIYDIGLSSGKFSLCMKAGIPTFISDLPTYIELNKKHNFGFIVNNVDDIVKALYTNINIVTKKQNCLKLFAEKLDPTYAIDEYLETYILS